MGFRFCFFHYNGPGGRVKIKSLCKNTRIMTLFCEVSKIQSRI